MLTAHVIIIFALTALLLVSMAVSLVIYRKMRKAYEKQMPDMYAVEDLTGQNKIVATLGDILDNIDVQIYISDPETGELLFTNKKLKKLFGRENDDLTGEFCFKVFRGADELCEFCPCRKLNKDPSQVIVWNEYFEPLNMHVRHTDCYIDWPGGKTAHLQYNIDITDLVKAKDEIEQGVRQKIDFLAKMSHETRTPMNAIIGMTELALRERTTKAKDAHLHTVKQAGENLLAIINDILDFSKFEAGRLEVVTGEYSVTSLLSDVVSIIRMRVVNSRKRFAVKADCNTPQVLLGDEARIRQVLLNVLGNAIKYTEKGHIMLGVSSENCVSGGETVNLIFEISDTGIGIKPEDMDKLFTDFTRFDLERNRDIEGSGLGLAITHSIVEAMGGTISVESEYGKGSVFTVKIPQICKPGETLARVVNPEEKRVLILDRRDIYVASLAYSLENLGVGYETVKDGIELYEKMASREFRYLFTSYPLFVKNEDTIQKFGKDFKIAILAEVGEILPEKYRNALSMPIYCTHIANVLNDEDSSFIYSFEGEIVEMFTAPGARVLVVDDIRTNLKVAEGLLKPYKMHVDLRLSGAEAVEAVQKAFDSGEGYDLVLMDNRMPVMDGVEATRRLRAMGKENPYYNELPIVVTTANIISGMMETFLRNGFSDALSKPIDTAKLNALLEKWIPKEKQM